MNQEQTYLANLATASGYSISGDTLTLTTGQGSLVFKAGVTTQ
jgi:heat shock protein HslJ